MRTATVTAAYYAGIYPGRADQVSLGAAPWHGTGGTPRRRRHDPDRVRVLASNAVMHSASRGQFFTVRAELYPDYVWIEVEDLGGSWRGRHSDGRPHGLDVVEALTGSGGWGVEPVTDGGRVVWARLDLAPGE